MKKFQGPSLYPPVLPQSCSIIDYMITDSILGCCESEEPSSLRLRSIFQAKNIFFSLSVWNHPKKLINEVQMLINLSLYIGILHLLGVYCCPPFICTSMSLFCLSQPLLLSLPPLACHSLQKVPTFINFLDAHLKKREI